MSKVFNLEEKFNEYFNELEGYSLRSERFYDSLDQFTSKEALGASLLLWLKAAYAQGARDMAQDTVDALRDYATACAGLDEELMTPTEKYDDVAANLMVYYTQVFNKE